MSDVSLNAQKAVAASAKDVAEATKASTAMASSGKGGVKYLAVGVKEGGVEILVEIPEGRMRIGLSEEDLAILARGDTIEFGALTLDSKTIHFLQDAAKVSPALAEKLQATKKPGFLQRLFGKKEDPLPEKTNVVNQADSPAKAYQNAYKGGSVELNENELVRFKGNGGKAVNQDYVQASKDARKYMIDAVESGKYTQSTNSYMETMNEMHKVSAKGKEGNLDWYKDAGQGSMSVNPGKIRGPGRLRNMRFEEAQRVEKIAKQYGDPFRATENSSVYLDGIPADNLPQNWYIGEKFYHLYPNGGDDLYHYYAQMRRTAGEAVDLINRQASETEIVAKLAEHYQYAANARPYGQINNSLFMNEVNTLLQKAGLRPMPHGELDIAAMHLQPATFKQYFVDTYYKTRL